MKKILLFLSIFAIVTMACDLLTTVAPPTSQAPAALTPIPATEIPASATSVPATSAPNPAPTSLQPSHQGAAVSYGSTSFVIPTGVASGFSASQFPRAEGDSVAPWEVTPGHTQINLDGYLLQGKFHQPQIFIYPATDYAEMYPGAFESIRRLDNILYGPGGPAINDQLPTVPFFNAQQVFASNVRILSFQNGGGVRFLTEYAQYAASANNYDLFYHFQGVTRDGAYYVIAILPISAPVLAETSDGGAVLPPGGIPYPDITSTDPDMQGYYAAVTALLDATLSQSFSPTLDQLDLLIQSMRISP